MQWFSPILNFFAKLGPLIAAWGWGRSSARASDAAAREKVRTKARRARDRLRTDDDELDKLRDG